MTKSAPWNKVRSRGVKLSDGCMNAIDIWWSCHDQICLKNPSNKVRGLKLSDGWMDAIGSWWSCHD